MTSKILIIIPARMGSSRFPGKPMHKINGIPMIEHVYENVRTNNKNIYSYVATCDKVISDHIISINGDVVLTGDYHERASDRCAEALIKIEKNLDIKFDIVVMVQGDEPMVNINMINESMGPLIIDESIMVSNLMGDIKTLDEFHDTNCIKVVHSVDNFALYFSRQPIPSLIKDKLKDLKKQVCVISFRRNFLLKYTMLEPTNLEIAESVDMMRILEHGFKIKLIPTKHESYAVDSINDIEKVKNYLRKEK